MSKHSSRGSKWNELRTLVLQRDNHTCVYCGREATQADHVVAKANGGKDELANLVAACAPCNNSKGSKVQTRLNWYDKRWIQGL